jgi:hypothetical protein
MRTADGTLVDLTAALNEAIAELGNPVADADGTLVSATSQLNELLAWAGSSLPPADGTLASATTTYNDFVNGTVINWRLQIATRWAGSGANQDGNRPLFGDEYEFIRWTDKTAQVMNQPGKRPKMQAYIIEAEVTEAVYTALEGDNKYLVFTAEPIIEEV